MPADVLIPQRQQRNAACLHEALVFADGLTALHSRLADMSGRYVLRAPAQWCLLLQKCSRIHSCIWRTVSRSHAPAPWRAPSRSLCQGLQVKSLLEAPWHCHIRVTAHRDERPGSDEQMQLVARRLRGLKLPRM